MAADSRQGKYWQQRSNTLRFSNSHCNRRRFIGIRNSRLANGVSGRVGYWYAPAIGCREQYRLDRPLRPNHADPIAGISCHAAALTIAAALRTLAWIRLRAMGATAV